MDRTLLMVIIICGSMVLIVCMIMVTLCVIRSMTRLQIGNTDMGMGTSTKSIPSVSSHTNSRAIQPLTIDPSQAVPSVSYPSNASDLYFKSYKNRKKHIASIKEEYDTPIPSELDTQKYESDDQANVTLCG